MIILIECIILCFVFTIFACFLFVDPIKSLYNYPKKIQERVKSMKEYANVIPNNKDKYLAKSIASLIIIIIVSLIMKFVNHYDAFLETFIASFIIWSVVNWYDVFVIDILWFCHSKRVIIKGTEDMQEEYHNYLFHIKGGLIGQVIGTIICIIVSLIVGFIL